MAAMADVIGLGVLLSWKDKASANIKKAERAVDNLGKSVDEVTEKTARLQLGFAKLGKVGAGLTAFGVAGAATFFGVTKAAGTFEDTLRDTMTMTGLTGEAFEKMEKELGTLALQMSTRFGMSASDINKSFYQVLSSGAKAGTRQFKALSESALMLAKVVGMEPAVAVESLSDALHSFEMDVANAEKMADVFFKTSMLGATTVPQMADAMKEASKVAVEMKIPLEDLAAVLTGFAGKGIKGAEAGTAFRMVMTKLAAPAKDAREALAKLGVQVYDSTTKKMRPILDVLSDMKRGLAHVTHEEREAALKAIAGEEAFSKLGGLLATDLSLLEGWSKELKVGGVIQAAFTQKARTLNFAFATMKESLRNVAIVLGQQLLPVITPALGRIALFAGKVREFLSAHPVLTKTAVLFGAIAATTALIVGPILTVVGIIGALGGIPAILGTVAAGFASLGSAAVALGGLISAAFWPVTAVAAGVALLYLAFKSNFLGIRAIVVSAGKVLWSFFKGIWTGIKSALYPLVAAFKETWTALKGAFFPIVEGGRAIGELLGISLKGSTGMRFFGETAKMLGKIIGYALVTPMRLLLTAITWLMRGFAFLIQKAGDLGRWLGEKLAPHFTLVKASMLYLLGPIGVVIAHFGKIKSAVSDVLNWVISNWGTIKDVMLSPIALILAGFGALKDGLTGTFTAIKDTVSGIFSSLKDSVVGALDWIWGKISWVIAKMPDVLLPEGLKALKATSTTPKVASFAGPGQLPVGGRMVVSATTPAVQSAMPRPTISRETMVMPAPAFANAGAGTVDQSIHIAPGAIVIHATKIDETVAMKIDRELAKLLERRRERR
jgi:TP901 family phage tail tape measure protein